MPLGRHWMIVPADVPPALTEYILALGRRRGPAGDRREFEVESNILMDMGWGRMYCDGGRTGGIGRRQAAIGFGIRLWGLNCSRSE